MSLLTKLFFYFASVAVVFYGLLYLRKPTFTASVQRLENLPAFASKDSEATPFDPALAPAIVGLYVIDDKGNKDFYCTGFIVSNKYILTASHCLVDSSQHLIKNKIEIRQADLTTVIGTGRAAAINLRDDVGAIVAGEGLDFSQENKFPINDMGFFNTPGPFLSCGFAWGSKPLVCTPFRPIGNDYFARTAQGNLFPGMSGGPVVDTSTGKVVGINIHVTQATVSAADLIGVWSALQIDEANDQ